LDTGQRGQASLAFLFLREYDNLSLKIVLSTHLTRLSKNSFFDHPPCPLPSQEGGFFKSGGHPHAPAKGVLPLVECLHTLQEGEGNPGSLPGELGGVPPTIIVPGKWTKADIRYQAENVATMKLQNAGCNCVASQVLVMSESWEQHDEFLEAVRQLMQELPARPSYYPGTAYRQQEAVKAHPEAELFSGDVPRTLILGIDPDAEAELCFQKELFSPVLAQIDLPGRDTADYLHNAVRFCNEKLYGTLGASILIHPKTMKQLGPDFEAALTALHYGAIGINIWNASAFLLVQATWGAFPGSTTDNIQSGFGIVGNSFMFEKPERTVVRGSFYPFPRSWLNGDPAFLPKPPWFLTNKTAHITTRGVVKITLDPKWRYLPAILLSALRG